MSRDGSHDLDQRRFQGVEVLEAPLWGADEGVSGGWRVKAPGRPAGRGVRLEEDFFFLWHQESVKGVQTLLGRRQRRGRE